MQSNSAVYILEVTMLLYDTFTAEPNSSGFLAVQTTDLSMMI